MFDYKVEQQNCYNVQDDNKRNQLGIGTQRKDDRPNQCADDHSNPVINGKRTPFLENNAPFIIRSK